MTVHVKAGTEKPHIPDLPAAPAANVGAKHPVRFQVEAKDKDGNPIKSNNVDVHVAGPEQVSNVNTQLLNDGKFLFQFETSVSTGEFTVTVKHNGQDIYRSPFTITLAPHTGSGPVKDVATLND